MKSKLQRIGNSKGIVIPKAILDQCGFRREVELRVEGNQLILSPATTARAGWSNMFEKAARGSPERLLPDHLSDEWDRREWTW